MGKRMNWERAKYRDQNRYREGEEARKLLEKKATELLGKGERFSKFAGIGKREYATMPAPMFSHAHAIYNDGTGERLYAVSRVVRNCRDQKFVGPELVVLKDEKTGLLLDPVSVAVVRGAKVLKPKA